MRRSSFDLHCSLAKSLEIVGEWWTLLILRDAFMGVSRFDDFQRSLKIARNVLANRLDTLVREGIFEQHPYDERRGRHDYVLTAKGRALWPVLVTLRQWGDQWVIGKGAEPALMEHRGPHGCGRRTTAELVCSKCGGRVTPNSARLVDGPGAVAS